MISILITAYKEAATIGKCIETTADPKFNGLENRQFEILLACPDDETLSAARAAVSGLGIEDKFVHVPDPGHGKPVALNLLMDKARGDIWVFTDGDTYAGAGAVGKIIDHFRDPKVTAVTGRPYSADSEDNFMGYIGHLLADAAHHKRNIDLTQAGGHSRLLVPKRNFFPVSGYLYAMRRSEIRVPENCLVDDAYVSYVIYNQGGRIAYEPEARVYIKYARSLSDYFKQKNRSTGGYIQLWEYGVVKPETKTRSFWRELEYFWFPIRYAKNIKQLFWSFLLYPIRLWMWIMIYWERKVIKKDFVKTWVRVESTK